MRSIHTCQNVPNWDSLVAQWLRLSAPNAGGVGWIPGWGTRCPHGTAKSSRATPKGPVCCKQGLEQHQVINVYFFFLKGASSKRPQTSVGEDVEKREPSCTVSGNADWCSRCPAKYRGFSKTKNYHMIQQFYSSAYLQRK